MICIVAKNNGGWVNAFVNFLGRLPGSDLKFGQVTYRKNDIL